MQLPPHECLVPVLHHYHSNQPRLRDYIDEPDWRAAAADRTLFLVMPHYERGSLRSFIAERRRVSPEPPFGLDWVWFGNLLLWTGITLLNAPSLLAPSPTSGGRLRRALRLGAAALSPLFMVALFSGQASGLPSLHVSPVPAPTVLRRPLRFSSRPTAPSATASSWRPSATVPTLATRRVPRKPPLPCPLHTAPSLLRLSPLGPSHGPGLPRCDAAALPDVGQPESSLVGR